MTWLVLAFFCGLSAGIVGKYRGQAFWMWFLIGACLPLVGTIAALLHRSERSEPRRRCEECGAVLPVHNQVCRRCGADLEYPSEVYVPGEGVYRERPAEPA